MSKKTKLSRKQLETLVRSKLQEKLNLQEDVGDVFGKQAARGEQGSFKAEDSPTGITPIDALGSADSWSAPVAKNQPVQEAQLNEFLQSMMDMYYGTGDYGSGGTIHGRPAKEDAKTKARTGGWAWKREDVPPEHQKPIQEAVPDLDVDAALDDMPELDDMPDIDPPEDVDPPEVAVTEQTDKEWYDTQLFESLKKTWIK